MRTRAKFNIQEIVLRPGQGSGGVVKLQAVSRGARNASWSQYTPSGTIEMHITNPVALGEFQRMVEQSRTSGKYPEMYVDFSPSEDGWAGDGHAFEASTEDIPEGSAYRDQCVQCGYLVDAECGPGKPSHPNG